MMTSDRDRAWRRRSVVLAMALVAGCGGATTETTPTTGPTTIATSPTTVSATPATTSAAPTTETTSTSVAPTTAPTSTPPTSSDPAPATTTATTTVPPPGALGRPDPALLEALPAETIPWDEVGPDWLAFAYPRNTSTEWYEAGRRQGLYLVDPQDRIYAVSRLPEDTDLVEVSWSGRVALLRGPYTAGQPLSVLDLQTTVTREVVRLAEGVDHYVLTRDGTGLWIYDLPWNDPPTTEPTVSISRLDLATLERTTVLEESIELDGQSGYYEWWVNNRGGVTELPSGEIVVAMPSGVRASSTDGRDVRRLDLPDVSCVVAGVWDDATVQVRCAIPELERCEGFETELWLAPIDGRPATLLASPPAGECVGYGSATALDDHLAVDAGFGSGECNGHVVVIRPGSTVDRWVPPLEEVNCNEWIVGVRNDVWLFQAANPYISRDFPIALFEVTPTDVRLIDLPAVWVMPLTP